MEAQNTEKKGRETTRQGKKRLLKPPPFVLLFHLLSVSFSLPTYTLARAPACSFLPPTCSHRHSHARRPSDTHLPHSRLGHSITTFPLPLFLPSILEQCVIPTSYFLKYPCCSTFFHIRSTHIIHRTTFLFYYSFLGILDFAPACIITHHTPTDNPPASNPLPFTL